MLILIGIVLVGLGAAWIAGNRTACLWFSVDVWIWRRVAGRELGPLYRKTHGVLTVCLGLLVLVVHRMASTGALFR